MNTNYSKMTKKSILTITLTTSPWTSFLPSHSRDSLSFLSPHTCTTERILLRRLREGGYCLAVTVVLSRPQSPKTIDHQHQQHHRHHQHRPVIIPSELDVRSRPCDGVREMRNEKSGTGVLIVTKHACQCGALSEHQMPFLATCRELNGTRGRRGVTEDDSK